VRRKVLSLVLIPVGIVAAFFGAVWFLFTDVISDPKEPRVFADFKAIGSSLKTYNMNAGHYPTTGQGLRALVERPENSPQPKRWVRITDSIPKDPWQTPYRYRALPEEDKRGFEITSAGKDARFGTKDDFSSLDEKK
jgi:general secretion pathway protein G